MTARPRLAVIGAGLMGTYHARVIAQSERCDLAVVVDPDEAAGRRLAERYGTGWLPEPDRSATYDAVVVASPTETHRRLVLDALGDGVPVLVEKPAGTNLAEAEELVTAAERAQVPLMCGFVERFNPAMLTVAPLVTDPVHITAIRHSPYANRIRTGVAWDLLIHDVDACLRLVDAEPSDVRVGIGYFHPSSAPGCEDVAEAVMKFPGGTVASASASRVFQRKVRTIVIAELKRAIEIDLLRRDVTIYRHVSADAQTDDGVSYRQQTIIDIPELVSAREPLAAQLDRFLDLVDGHADAKQELESILPPHRVIDKVMASAR